MKSPRIRHNILQNLIFAVLPVGLFLVTVPIYIHLVGTERYGVLSLVWVLAGSVTFMSFGSGDALIRRIAEMKDADAHARERVVWSGIWTTACLGMIAAAIVWLVGEPSIAKSIRSTPQFLGEIHRSIPWLMLSIVSNFVFSAISGVIEGVERFVVVNITRLIGSIGTALVPLAVAAIFGPKLDLLVAATLVSSLLPAIGLMAYLVVHFPLTRVHAPRWGDSAGMLRFGGWITVAAVVNPIMTTFDRFVVSAVLGPTAVSHYVVPQGIVNRFATVPAEVTRTLFPRLAGLSESDGAQLLSGRAVRVVGAVIAPLLCGAILLVEPFLARWISTDFAHSAAPVARILLFAMFFNSVAMIPFNHMRGVGDARTPALLYVAELLPFVVLAWTCIHAWGILGAALAASIRTIADFFIMCRFARLRVQDVASLWPLCVLLVVALVAAFMVHSLLLDLVVAVGLGLVTTFVGCFVSPELKGLATAMLPRRGILSKLR